MTQPGDSMTYQRLRVVAVVAILALLVTSNVLLLDIADDPEPRQTAASTPGDGDAPPPLPPTSGQGSSRALLRELERTQRELIAPLARVVQEIQALRVTASAVQPLPDLLGRVAASTSGLSTIGPDLGRLAGGVGELERIRRIAAALNQEASGLSALDARFAGIQQSLARIDERIAALVARFGTLEGGVQSLLPPLTAMAEDVDRIRQCSEQPALCGGR